MKVGVIGAGYAGLTLACLADKGHEVIFIDVDENKVKKINEGLSPIFEPGLDDIIRRNIGKRIWAFNDYHKLIDCDVIFICVPTPSNDDGSINLYYVRNAIENVAKVLKFINKFVVIAVKSTVLPGTTISLIPIIEEISGKKATIDFGICMNPEFLKEGSAVRDFLNPDKVVIGIIDEKSKEIMLELYKWVDDRVPRIVTNPNTAEMIKYAQNAALASRISFINEIANICEKFNVDILDVAYAIGLDPRIGPYFLKAGIGFGGSCLPKDLKALINAAESKGVDVMVLKSILERNEKQPYRAIELLKSFIPNLKNKKIALLGLSFKSNTDDIRESSAIKIAKKLIEEGAYVKVYDPKAMENAKKVLGEKVEYCKSAIECLKDSDACIIATDWEEFKDIHYSKFKIPIIDGRRILDRIKAKNLGNRYKGIGWPAN
ncbi:MAG: UDP-glucose/GDP-mannose dehydrogenase family protein [Thermoproteota archaeon]|nr:UDP-glucose/GDP-mannose dehydrogenase family protein [Thermoproteota archaeon]